MNKNLKRKRIHRCVVEGCKMRLGTNNLSQVQLFRFPKDPHIKRLWEMAVNRKDWIATTNSVICNKHFINGRPSKDPRHPDYVPTIFYNSSNISTLRQASKTHFQTIKKRKSSHNNEGETKEIEDDNETEQKDTRTVSDLAKEGTNQIGIVGQGKNTPNPTVLKIAAFSSASTFQKHGRDIGSPNTKRKDDTCEYILPD